MDAFMPRAIAVVRRNLSIAATPRRRIVIIGDSHTKLFAQEAGFAVVYLGPVTLHRLGRPNELLRGLRGSLRFPILALPGFRIGPRDLVLVSAGEIDVRCHVHGQVDSGREPSAVIDQLVQGAVGALSEIQRARGCKGGVLGLPPPARRQPPDATNEYPIRGTLRQRVDWTGLLNRGLERALSAEGHLFVPMPDGLSDPDGALWPRCSDGNIHLDPGLSAEVAGQIRRSIGPPKTVRPDGLTWRLKRVRCSATGKPPMGKGPSAEDGDAGRRS